MEVEYLEEYEDLILPTINSPPGVPRRPNINMASTQDDEDSSSIDQDIFESLFDDNSDDDILQKKAPPVDPNLSRRRPDDRDSLDSLDMLVKDLEGEPLEERRNAPPPPVISKPKSTNINTTNTNTAARKSTPKAKERTVPPVKKSTATTATTSKTVKQKSTASATAAKAQSTRPPAKSTATTNVRLMKPNPPVQRRGAALPVKTASPSFANTTPSRPQSAQSRSSTTAGLMTMSARKQISAATSTTTSETNTNKMPVATKAASGSTNNNTPQRRYNGPAPTIVKPEKQQFKDPAEDPLGFDDFDDTIESDCDSFTDDTFASLSDLDDDEHVIELSNDSIDGADNAKDLEKIRGATPSPTVSEDFKSYKDDSFEMLENVSSKSRKAVAGIGKEAFIDLSEDGAGPSFSGGDAANKESDSLVADVLPEKVTILSDTLLTRIDTALLESMSTKEASDSPVKPPRVSRGSSNEIMELERELGEYLTHKSPPDEKEPEPDSISTTIPTTASTNEADAIVASDENVCVTTTTTSEPQLCPESVADTITSILESPEEEENALQQLLEGNIADMEQVGAGDDVNGVEMNSLLEDMLSSAEIIIDHSTNDEDATINEMQTIECSTEQNTDEEKMEINVNSDEQTTSSKEISKVSAEVSDCNEQAISTERKHEELPTQTLEENPQAKVQEIVEDKKSAKESNKKTTTTCELDDSMVKETSENEEPREEVEDNLIEKTVEETKEKAEDTNENQSDEGNGKDLKATSTTACSRKEADENVSEKTVEATKEEAEGTKENNSDDHKTTSTTSTSSANVIPIQDETEKSDSKAEIEKSKQEEAEKVPEENELSKRTEDKEKSTKKIVKESSINKAKDNEKASTSISSSSSKLRNEKSEKTEKTEKSKVEENKDKNKASEHKDGKNTEENMEKKKLDENKGKKKTEEIKTNKKPQESKESKVVESGKDKIKPVQKKPQETQENKIEKNTEKQVVGSKEKNKEKTDTKERSKLEDCQEKTPQQKETAKERKGTADRSDHSSKTETKEKSVRNVSKERPEKDQRESNRKAEESKDKKRVDESKGSKPLEETTKGSKRSTEESSKQTPLKGPTESKTSTPHKSHSKDKVDSVKKDTTKQYERKEPPKKSEKSTSRDKLDRPSTSHKSPSSGRERERDSSSVQIEKSKKEGEIVSSTKDTKASIEKPQIIEATKKLSEKGPVPVAEEPVSPNDKSKSDSNPKGSSAVAEPKVEKTTSVDELSDKTKAKRATEKETNNKGNEKEATSEETTTKKETLKETTIKEAASKETAAKLATPKESSSKEEKIREEKKEAEEIPKQTPVMLRRERIKRNIIKEKNTKDATAEEEKKELSVNDSTKKDCEETKPEETADSKAKNTDSKNAEQSALDKSVKEDTSSTSKESTAEKTKIHSNVVTESNSKEMSVAGKPVENVNAEKSIKSDSEKSSSEKEPTKIVKNLRKKVVIAGTSNDTKPQNNPVEASSQALPRSSSAENVRTVRQPISNDSNKISEQQHRAKETANQQTPKTTTATTKESVEISDSEEKDVITRRSMRKRCAESPLAPPNESSKKLFKEPITPDVASKTRSEQQTLNVSVVSTYPKRNLKSPAYPDKQQSDVDSPLAKKPRLETKRRVRLRNLDAPDSDTEASDYSKQSKPVVADEKQSKMLSRNQKATESVTKDATASSESKESSGANNGNADQAKPTAAEKYDSNEPRSKKGRTETEEPPQKLPRVTVNPQVEKSKQLVATTKASESSPSSTSIADRLKSATPNTAQQLAQKRSLRLRAAHEEDPLKNADEKKDEVIQKPQTSHTEAGAAKQADTPKQAGTAQRKTKRSIRGALEEDPLKIAQEDKKNEGSKNDNATTKETQKKPTETQSKSVAIGEMSPSKKSAQVDKLSVSPSSPTKKSVPPANDSPIAKTSMKPPTPKKSPNSVMTFADWLERQKSIQSDKDRLLNKTTEASSSSSLPPQPPSTEIETPTKMADLTDKEEAVETPQPNANTSKSNKKKSKSSKKKSHARSESSARGKSNKKSEIDILIDSMSKEMKDKGVHLLLREHSSRVTKSVAASVGITTPTSKHQTLPAAATPLPSLSTSPKAAMKMNQAKEKPSTDTKLSSKTKATLDNQQKVQKLRKLRVRLNRAIVKSYIKKINWKSQHGHGTDTAAQLLAAAKNRQKQLPQQQGENSNNSKQKVPYPTTSINLTQKLAQTAVSSKVLSTTLPVNATSSSSSAVVRNMTVGVATPATLNKSLQQQLSQPLTNHTGDVRIPVPGRANVLTIPAHNRRAPLKVSIQHSSDGSNKNVEYEPVSPKTASLLEDGLDDAYDLLEPMKTSVASMTSMRKTAPKRVGSQKQFTKPVAVPVNITNNAVAPPPTDPVLISNAPGNTSVSEVLPEPQFPIVEPKKEVEDDHTMVQERIVVVPATAAANIAANAHQNVQQNANNAAFGVSPTVVDANGTRLYSFLHPAKFNRSHGGVLLDYCCPNLDGPMPAIDPTRIHSQVQTVVRELPAFIVMTTKQITRADLEANKNSIPAAIRQKVEKMTGRGQASAATPPPPPPTATPTAAQLQAQSSQISASISALQKQLPATTTIRPKGLPVNEATPAYNANSNTNHVAQPPLVLDYQHLSTMRSNMRRFDSILKIHCQRINAMSFVDRQRSIESLVKTTNLTPKDIENATRLVEEYANKLQLIVSYSAAATSTTTTNATQKPMEQQTQPNYMGAGLGSKVKTLTIPTRPSLPPQPPQKKHVPIYDSDKMIIGYQLQVGAPSSSNVAVTKPIMSTRSDIMSASSRSQNLSISLTPNSSLKQPAQDSPRIFYTSPMMTSTPIAQPVTTSSVAGASSGTSVSARLTQRLGRGVTIRQINTSASTPSTATTPNPHLPPLTRNPHIAASTPVSHSSKAVAGGTPASASGGDIVTIATKRMTTRKTAAAAAQVIVITKDQNVADECILPDGNSCTQIKREKDDDIIGGN